MVRSVEFQNLSEAALDRCPALVASLIPGGRLQGNEYVVLNPTRGDRHPGSFSINIQTGRWCDFATGDRGGDLVALVAYVKGLPQGEAARELRRMLGGRYAAC